MSKIAYSKIFICLNSNGTDSNLPKDDLKIIDRIDNETLDKAEGFIRLESKEESAKDWGRGFTNHEKQMINFIK